MANFYCGEGVAETWNFEMIYAIFMEAKAMICLEYLLPSNPGDCGLFITQHIELQNKLVCVILGDYIECISNEMDWTV